VAARARSYQVIRFEETPRERYQVGAYIPDTAGTNWTTVSGPLSFKAAVAEAERLNAADPRRVR
jgi:hypothetical protein